MRTIGTAFRGRAVHVYPLPVNPASMNTMQTQRRTAGV